MGAGAAFIMPATLSLLISVFTDARERAIAIGIWAGDRGPRRRARPGRRRLPARPLLVGLDLHRQRPAVVARDRRRARGSSRSRATRSRGAIDWTGAGALRRRPGRPGVGDHRGAGRGLDVRAGARRRRARRGRARPRSCVRQRRVARAAARRPPLPQPALHRRERTITVLFFALFGFLFLATQYLQFVLGYSPSAAGVRMLPYAGRDDRVRAAVVEARRAVRHQARRRPPGCCCSRPAWPSPRRVDAEQRLRRGSRVAMVLMGAGMGLAGAPATESIMGSLPPERANRLGGQRHDARARRRARRRHRRQHRVVALTGAARRRRLGARRLRPRARARVARGRRRRAARRPDRLAPPARGGEDRYC